MVRVKRRRLNWECHLKANDVVVVKSNICNYIGVVLNTKLRQFGDNYNRVVVQVKSNYVTSVNYSHIYNNTSLYDQFYLTPFTTENGKIMTKAERGNRLFKLDQSTELCQWRNNLKLNQELFYRSATDKRRRLKCVVVDVQDKTVSIQPKFSKIITVVDKQSEQIQPVINIIYEEDDVGYEIPDLRLSYDHEYIIQSPMCRSMDIKDKYLGAYCKIKSRIANLGYEKRGYIIDVDHGVAEGKNLYCYVEDSAANEIYMLLRFHTHMQHVEWVTEDDIEIIDVGNKLSNRNHVELPNRILSIQYNHGMCISDVNRITQLCEHDIELAMSYILSHAKSNSDSNIMYALAHLMWCNNSYKIRPVYSQHNDDYDYIGLKEILLAKQYYFMTHKNENQLKQVTERIAYLLDIPNRSRSHMAQILEAEENFRSIPLFKFTPLSIQNVNNSFHIKIDVAMNNIHTLDILAYPGAAVNFNRVALQPIMKRLLNKFDTEGITRSDVFRMSRYAKIKTKEFQEDTTNYVAENKISSLKKYQSWMVKKMVEEEQSKEPLSQMFSTKIGDDLEYNFINGFTSTNCNSTNGGIVSLEVGWGKTVLILELLLRQGGSTLICAPLTLIDQWKGEVERFAPSLSMCEYYGRERRQDADVVFTTYGTLRAVFNDLKTFDRVVFDESHIIKNPSSQRARACFNVKAKFRWCVSATPYNDNNTQFQTQLRLLNVKPFDSNVPLLNNNRIFIPMFKRIMFSLDAKKLNRMGIKPIETKIKATNVVCVDTTPELTTLLDSIKNNVKVNSHFISVLKPAATRMQISCTDPSLFALTAFSRRCENKGQEVTKDQLIKSLDKRTNISTEYKNSVIEKLREENTGTCCICLCEYEEATITPCLHIYCNHCIKESLKVKPQCPQCRQKINVGQLKVMVKSNVEDNTVDNIYHFTDVIGDSYTVPVEVRDAYQKMKEKVPNKFTYIKNFIMKNDKSCVIFSQYSLPLDRLKRYLKNNNIDCGLISGKTSRKKRGNMIKDFSEGTLKTFLLSTKTAAVGLNLQRGSTIIFLEPVISADEQTQSIGRLYRIGQEEDIDVIQLCTKGTYEETMCKKLQEYKQDQREINRNFKGREKIQKQSQLKREIFQDILL